MSLRSESYKDLPENMSISSPGSNYRYTRWHNGELLALTLGTRSVELGLARHKQLAKYVEGRIKKGVSMGLIKKNFMKKKVWKDGGKITGQKERSANYGTRVVQPKRDFPEKIHPSTSVVDKAGKVNSKELNLEDDCPEVKQEDIAFGPEVVTIGKESLEILEMVVNEAITPTVLFTGNLEDMKKEAEKVTADSLKSIKNWVVHALNNGGKG